MNLPKGKKPPCAELARAAEREFTAFFSAAIEMLGVDNAKVAAEEWLEEFRAIQLPTVAPEHACRQVTVFAAACLGRKVSLQQPALRDADIGRTGDESIPSSNCFTFAHLL